MLYKMTWMENMDRENHCTFTKDTILTYITGQQAGGRGKGTTTIFFFNVENSEFTLGNISSPFVGVNVKRREQKENVQL